MFTQFRVRYPKGCLISELLTIKHGKYVVRAMIQIEGVTLATGMAAAETVELAEDQARTRALAVLEIHPATANDVRGSGVAPYSTNTPVRVERPEMQELAAQSVVIAPSFASSAMDTSQVASEMSVPRSVPATMPQPAFSSEQPRQDDQIPIYSETFGMSKDAASLSSREPRLSDVSSSGMPISWEANSIPFGDDFSFGELEMPEERDAYEVETPPTIQQKPVFDEPLSRMEYQGNQGTPEESQINVPVTPASQFSFGQSPTNIGDTSLTSGSVDMSEIIARTDVEMKRLGWSTKKGRDHLVQTYGKRGRAQLTNEELLDFLHYLEAQPSPEY